MWSRISKNWINQVSRLAFTCEGEKRWSIIVHAAPRQEAFSAVSEAEIVVSRTANGKARA